MGHDIDPEAKSPGERQSPPRDLPLPETRTEPDQGIDQAAVTAAGSDKPRLARHLMTAKRLAWPFR
jgi:hypothetical protein